MGHSSFRLKDGRQIGVSATGDPLADRLVIFFHPTPGAGIFDPDPILTGSWGVHILAIERPGYGGTTPFAPGQRPTFSAMADDVAEFLLSAEGMARSIQGVNYGPVGVIGWSTGCLVALHLAARYPDLVDKLALIDPPRPAHNLDAAARSLALPPEIADAVGRSLPLPVDTLHMQFSLNEAGLEGEDDDLEKYPGLGHRLQRMVDAALVNEAQGVGTDLQALSDPTALPLLRAVTTPTLIFPAGDKGPHSVKEVRRYSRHLANAELRKATSSSVPAIVTQWETILEHVAPHHGDIPPRDR